MSIADAKLDLQLRAVPLPEGLTERLRAVVWTEDDGLDAVLREVPLPPKLLGRLKRVPLADDAGVDEALRSVPVPDRLAAAWRRRAKRRERFASSGRLAVAASLLAALAIFSSSAAILMMATGHWPFAEGPEMVKVPDVPPLEEQQLLPLERSWAGQPAEVPSAPMPLAAAAEVGLARLDQGPGPATALGGGLNLPPGADPLLPPNNILGSPRLNSFDELKELPRPAADLVPRGIEWPVVPGSNYPFLKVKGFHPFVSPAAHPRLQTCLVPLGIDAASYELARRYVEEGWRPPPDLVRTEEFLAAVDYDYPRPAQQALGLTLAGGPSPLSGAGFCLLQIGVQARQVPDAGHSDAQLVLLVDTSASMRWGSRIDGVRRSLADLAGRLAGADRVSLVSFNQAAHVLVQDVGPAEIGQFLAGVRSLSAEGATDAGGGLRAAYSLAMELTAPGRPPACVILLTDGLLELDPEGAGRIARQAAEAARHGTRLHVIDMGQQKQASADLAAFARSGQGSLHRATNAEQVRWAIGEILTGRSQQVARDARLRVTFNPQTVLEYRLLGHEAREWAGMMPGPLQADLYDGQSATALVEVRLAGKGPNEVASVELSWSRPGEQQAPAGPDLERLTASIERKDFAPSLSKSPLCLQEAAVVAQTAEALGRSPFIMVRTPQGSVTRALVHTLELSGQVDSRLYQRPSFAEFVALIQHSIKAKTYVQGAWKP
ncbi:MAG: von Willebrand factor type A domain-containing protein [Thermoguttaceae bacterium]|jgi:Ca-activated chloride channel family protein